VPLVAQGESLGVLQLQFPEPEEGRHDPGGERLIQLLAENLALALANLKLRETLRYQSIRDPLTGLFNRRYLEESLERELHRARRGKRAVAVLMLDLDHFKRFNDEHGHAAGDALLREVGGLLKNKVRGSDVACRYGGEELAIILPEAELRDAAHRADQIRDAIRRLAIQQAGQTLGSVTVSIGIATYPQHGESVEQLLSQADAALYRAKDLGRDRVELAGEG
jgi:diguanylate cyclase (GGDEF)-like protein